MYIIVGSTVIFFEWSRREHLLASIKNQTEMPGLGTGKDPASYELPKWSVSLP